MGRLSYDPRRAVSHLKAADPVLASVIARVGPFTFTPERTSGTFEALAEAIVYQQLNGKAAGTIYARVQALFGRAGLEPRALARMSAPRLRAAGLSAAKLAALKDLAAKTIAGEVPTLREARVLSDEALIERLTRVRGIGPWTAHMFLLFRLGRPDVLPTGDFAVQRAVGLLYGLRGHPKPEQVARAAEPWRPFRSVASWYLWRSLDAATL
ncbi:MAG TPA: DNA-3-methyladenine glycosylase 2 family protein [Elusimicrobiota bacterium]|jgi:3-methyladenine DNA glycosylase/8-oxoguanine DNA glycosylase|nr:DNA-3-methyladenine glycosylase 2 family protein [Elusimicrobiota bacterium]